jgi:hypothetical protein
MTREELGNNISAYIASVTMGCTNIEVTSAIMRAVDEYAPPSASLKPIQHAYALLWRDMGPKSQEVREARAVLLASLTKDEQREAISWVQDERPITEAEVMALIVDDHSAPVSFKVAQ